MRIPVVLLVTAGLLAHFTPLRADAPTTAYSGDRTVGSVYGNPITTADIGFSGRIDPTMPFDSPESVDWNLMKRIMTVFGKPVIDRFVEEKKIDATAEELEAATKTMRKGNEQRVRETQERLEKIKTELASPDLSDQDKAKLQEEQTIHEQSLPTLREIVRDGPSESILREFIIAWKIERELHRTYGGRVIFQQMGLEALDARRLLFEQAEKTGDLKFDDAGVRHLFYFYSNIKHIEVDDEKMIERAWFLGDVE